MQERRKPSVQNAKGSIHLTDDRDATIADSTKAMSLLAGEIAQLRDAERKHLTTIADLRSRLAAAEAERDVYKRDSQIIQSRAGQHEARAEALEAALRFYADRQIYFHDDGKCSLACADEGDKARAAIPNHQSQEARE